MKKSRVFFATGIIVALVFVCWWMQSTPRPIPSTGAKLSSQVAQAVAAPSTSVPTQDQTERRKKTVDNILNVLGTSISFYGKVVDQNGNPVPDANVQYGAIDKFDADGSHYEGKSDANGLFSISGIKGAVLTVGVWKEGYYNINDKSDGAFAYGAGVDPTRKVAPKKEKPAVFVLQKKGTTVPLIQLSRRQVDVPKTGVPLSIDLTAGKIGGTDLTLESWTGIKVLNHFDWSYRLSVSGGGLIERKDEFDFEAPAEGYHQQTEVKMPADAPQWSSRLSKQYFAKLPGGRYARFSIRFYPGVKDDGTDRNFVVLESYLNPTPGDRNLEFEPAKAVKSP